MKGHPSAPLEPSNTKATRARPTAPYPARRTRGCWSTLAVLMAALAVLMFLVLATLVSGYMGLRETWRVSSIATSTPWPTFTPTVNWTPQSVALAPTDAIATLAPAAAAVDPAPTLALPAATPTLWPTFTPAPVSVAGGDQVTTASNPPPATPTATSSAPTVAPTATATSAPQPPTPTSPPPPPPSQADTNPATAADAGGANWSFVGTRVETEPTRKLMLVFGELVNNSDATQQLSQVTANFFDGQGNLLMADKSTTGLWPTRNIPAGAQVPFALTIRGVVEVDSFDLAVDAQTVSSSPRQDFEFLGVNERSQGTQYCLGGALKNPGAETARSVVVAAILYDGQGNVLRFGTDVAAVLEAGQSTDFEVCLKSLPENPARYDLRAWGS